MPPATTDQGMRTSPVTENRRQLRLLTAAHPQHEGCDVGLTPGRVSRYSRDIYQELSEVCPGAC
jgi:hypothetical protein